MLILFDSFHFFIGYTVFLSGISIAEIFVYPAIFLQYRGIRTLRKIKPILLRKGERQT
ncbi:hypothetical protein HMPREF1199_01944 [Hoylesella oralis CC98A]|nr:hypothetical protein HMPREF1199_01944 [Hoylesella oralis CC98A]